jgi:hypothetical protein
VCLNLDEKVISVLELCCYVFLDEKEYDYSYDAQGNKIEGERIFRSLFL